ncbi:hypothetical protein N0V83_008959 [Neocucurbitaria cava]|uniref:SUZ domain-containing protein n=1 Tax=Neocucurbitaria cava TaxID=798079 RepID=A0A9W8Y305_9PLEO|nr:hypothetical protein N0V83_008959 [Neocucurbitaria cava]
MVDPAKSASTPPVELPARKIMRRDDGKSGTNTTANSQNPSKTTSEVGGSDGSNDGSDGKEKDKATLTREEREARYREARQRIFGSAESEENDATDGTGLGEEKERDNDVSRSSSTSGKKKVKKPRNYDDDDFQARSHFNAYYPQQYPGPGYTGDNVVYYNGFAAPMPNSQYPSMNPGASPSPPAYSIPYSGMMSPDAQPQYGWPSQQYQPSNSSMMYPTYGQAPNGYDLSTDFQRGMSFQNAAVPSQVTPKMTNPQMASYQDAYQQPQQMPMNSAWPQMGPQPSYPMAQGSYAQPGPGNRPMSAPHQAPMPGPYPYGQFPSSTYNGKPGRNQHPIPGSYNRQQFNPQTQAFIPGGRNMPYAMQPNMSQGQPHMNSFGGFQMPPQNILSAQIPRLSPPATNTPSFGSPQSIQGNNSGIAMRKTASQSRDEGIGKWGTPSHLPPKPPVPVPAPQSAPKFTLPSMTNMSSGLVNNAPAVSIRGGSGGNSLNGTNSN